MNKSNTKQMNEATLSHLPAARVLQKLGWEYLSRDEVRAAREGNTSSFLLQEILENQLHKINREQKFTEQEIRSATYNLKSSGGDLLSSNIEIYKLLSSGTTIDKWQSAGGSVPATCRFIDWRNFENNLFQFTSEFTATQGTQSIRLDLLLFINGIPITAIECKSPVAERDAKQQLENYQSNIPSLFVFTQMLLAIDPNDAKYSAAAIRNRWNVWREQPEENLGIGDRERQAILAESISTESRQKINEDFGVSDSSNDTTADSEQNKLLIHLLSPKRFLEIINYFTITGPNSKKLALSHQYFLVKNALERVCQVTKTADGSKRRKGGVVWHTQGSGKSITMMMLIKNLKAHLAGNSPRIILVSDRIDLNNQMKDNIEDSDFSYKIATSGKHLHKLIMGGESVILTNMQKFTRAAVDRKTGRRDSNPDHNIFLLIDECHRTQYGDYAKEMRQLLSNACYIGFTGTPLLEKEKRSTFATFGEFIQPTYPIREALKDNTIVPLLYEGRDFEADIDGFGIDVKTEKAIRELNSAEERAMKQKFSNIITIKNLESVIKEIAADMAKHFKYYINRYPNSPHNIKAQVVTLSKAHGVLYHRALLANGIKSKLIISPPGVQDDEEENRSISRQDALNLVNEFWEEEVGKGDPTGKNYERKVIRDFKDAPDPQVLVVVDKLITGFDAPKNTILYLCKKLRDHTLLQAIARVNRTMPGKEHGLIVDYMLLFPDLTDALNAYDALSGYSSGDLEDTLENVSKLLEAFENDYEELKEILKPAERANEEETWIILTNLIRPGSIEAERFVNLYKRMRQYFAIIASTMDFKDKYQGERVDELNRYMRLAAMLFDYLIKNLRHATSSELELAENLIAAAINDNVSVYGFPPVGILPADEIINPSDQPIYFPRVEEEPENYAAPRRGYGTSPITSSFSIYQNKLRKLKRQVELRRESHPKNAEALSKLIQKELDRCQELADRLREKTIRYENLQRELEKWEEEERLEHWEKQLESQSAVEVPDELADLPEAGEYYLAYEEELTMLKDDIGSAEIEAIKQDLCKIARSTHDYLEGRDNYGWWKDLNAESTTIYKLMEQIWLLEDSHNISLPPEKERELAEKVLKIGRARANLAEVESSADTSSYSLYQQIH